MVRGCSFVTRVLFVSRLCCYPLELVDWVSDTSTDSQIGDPAIVWDRGQGDLPLLSKHPGT